MEEAEAQRRAQRQKNPTELIDDKRRRQEEVEKAKRLKQLELEEKRDQINYGKAVKQMIQDEKNKEKMRIQQESKRKLQEEKERVKLARQQEREAMKQDLMQKRKQLADGEAPQNNISFEIVGVPEVLLQDTPKVEKKSKVEALSPAVKNVIPPKTRTQERRSKADRSKSGTKEIEPRIGASN